MKMVVSNFDSGWQLFFKNTGGERVNILSHVASQVKVKNV